MYPNLINHPGPGNRPFKTFKHETKNNFNMGRNFDNALDRWTTPGSILPITPYELWQMERFGNFIPERPIIETNEKTQIEKQIELYEQIDLFR